MKYKLPKRMIENILYYGKDNTDGTAMSIVFYIPKSVHELLNEMNVGHPFTLVDNIFIAEKSSCAFYFMTEEQYKSINVHQEETYSLIKREVLSWDGDKSTISEKDLRNKCCEISTKQGEVLKEILYDMVEPYLEMTKEEYTMVVMSV